MGTVRLRSTLALVGLIGFANAAGHEHHRVPQAPADSATTSTIPFPSYLKPVRSLPVDERPMFYAGQALAKQPWVKAPTITTARDGLGPVYNARSCLACHQQGGRGRLPSDQQTPLAQSVIRISVPGQHPTLGVHPEPRYGTQIQHQSTALSHQLRIHNAQAPVIASELPAEARIFLNWHTKTVHYPDGDTAELRYPVIRLDALGYGDMATNTLTSLRNAPAITGSGLIELIADTDIAQRADPHDTDGNGISGRLNRVWNPRTQQHESGRFGWKANLPADLTVVAAAAFHQDIGITSTLYPQQPCTAVQTACLASPSGADADGVELPDDLLTLVANYLRNLGVPENRSLGHAKTETGRKLFRDTGCADCHTPRFTTRQTTQAAHLSGLLITPYSDFLLHDMGPDLADGRSDFTASGREWRTPPLWGIGLSDAINGNAYFLHDGRARSVEEAILWHGGEAKRSRDAFIRHERPARRQLLDFVESL